MNKLVASGSRTCKLHCCAALSMHLALLAVALPPANAAEPVSGTSRDAPAGAHTGGEDSEKAAAPLALFDREHLAGWKPTPFDDAGSCEFKGGEYAIAAGQPMAGITWERAFPKSNYEITLEAQRAEGSDFFCGMTFPVGEEFCSLIVGGWGGGLVGLSSLNGHDASENETTRFDHFENGRWYEIRLAVTDVEVEAWIDNRRILRVKRAGHDFSVRFEVKLSRPFGLATYQTAALFRNLLLRRLAPPETHPGSIYAEIDVPYAATNHARQRLDLYLPAERTSHGPLPVVVAIHGGAWLQGDKRQMLPILKPLVESGRYAGAAVAYRLSHDAQWPAQIDDCKAAIRWIRRNADRYGLDPDRIGAVGLSAGGHLAAMLGVTGENVEQSLENSAPSEDSSRVSCVVDFYGPSDMLTLGDPAGDIDPNRPDSPEAKLLGGPISGNRKAAQSASPTTYATHDDAPMLLIHGENDRLVPYAQSQSLQQALRDVDVSATLITIEGGGHGGFDGPALQSLVTQFLDKHLHRTQSAVIDQTLQPGQAIPAK